MLRGPGGPDGPGRRYLDLPFRPIDHDGAGIMDDTHRQRVARHLFQKSSDALFLFDLGGHRVVDANAAARRLTGFDATSLRGMTLEGLLAAGAPDGPGPSGPVPVPVEHGRDEPGVSPF